LAKLESLRAELAQSNRKVDTQVVDIHDLQKKWDAAPQDFIQKANNNWPKVLD
jgi:hypothetical protein